MKFEDLAEHAILDMIKTPVPKTRFKSKNYNYSISFENTRFSWYSSLLNDYILSVTGANIDFFCTTRHGDFLKTYILPSRQFSDTKEFAKIAIQNAIDEYREIYKQYKINENAMKRIEKSSLSGFAFESIATGKDDKQRFTYNCSIYFGDKVLILMAIVPASAPREIFWEVKQIIDSVELVSQKNGEYSS